MGYGIGVLFADHPAKNGIIRSSAVILARKSLQDMIGGKIRIVPTAIAVEGCGSDRIVLVADQNGRPKGKTYNTDASDISMALSGMIAGDALLVGQKGDALVSLPYEWLDRRFASWKLYHKEVRLRQCDSGR